MKTLKIVSTVILATSLSFAVNSNAAGIIHFNNPEMELSSSNIILVESSRKAAKIIAVLQRDGGGCSNVSLEQRTACLARTLKKAASVTRQQGFGDGRVAKAFNNAAGRMRRLPDDGSEKSFIDARGILDSLNNDIRAIAKTRPSGYRIHNIQVARSVLKLKKVVRKGKS